MLLHSCCTWGPRRGPCHRDPFLRGPWCRFREDNGVVSVFQLSGRVYLGLVKARRRKCEGRRSGRRDRLEVEMEMRMYEVEKSVGCGRGRGCPVEVA